jgi:hypothetical protein
MVIPLLVLCAVFSEKATLEEEILDRFFNKEEDPTVRRESIGR